MNCRRTLLSYTSSTGASPSRGAAWRATRAKKPRRHETASVSQPSVLVLRKSQDELSFVVGASAVIVLAAVWFSVTAGTALGAGGTVAESSRGLSTATRESTNFCAQEPSGSRSGLY